MTISPGDDAGWTGGRTARRAPSASSVIMGSGLPTRQPGVYSCSGPVANTWSTLEVWACEPSQNSVAPFEALNSHSGMLAMK